MRRLYITRIEICLLNSFQSVIGRSTFNVKMGPERTPHSVK